MCPKDPGVVNTQWFPDEPVCRVLDVPDWVRRQRKIAKAGGNFASGFFTLPMLEHRCVIGKNIGGIDPDGTDTERKTAEKRYFEKHPALKPLSEEKRAKLAERLSLKKGDSLGKFDQKEACRPGSNAPLSV